MKAARITRGPKMDFDELGSPSDDDLTVLPGHRIGYSLAENETYQLVLGTEVAMRFLPSSLICWQLIGAYLLDIPLSSAFARCALCKTG